MRWLAGLTAVLVLGGTITRAIDDRSLTIPVTVSVTDDHGQPILDLPVESFEALTDGDPTRIAGFDRPGQPFSVALVFGTGVMVRGGLGSVREGGHAFVRGLRDADRAIVCAYGMDVTCEPAFTTDRVELLNRVERIQYQHGTRVFEAIDAAIARLHEVEGRRVVVALTARFDTDSAVKPSLVRAHARQRNVMVYVIGVDERDYDGDEFVVGRPDPELQQLVRETGGRYLEVEGWDEVPSAFATVSRELHSQYTLELRASVDDTRVHSVTIRLNRPQLHVRARRTFQVSSR